MNLVLVYHGIYSPTFKCMHSLQIRDSIKAATPMGCSFVKSFYQLTLLFTQYFAWSPFHPYNKFSLHLILKLLYERLSQSRGILLFRMNKRFASALSPTFLKFVFIVWNNVCLEVRTWLKFKNCQTSESLPPLYSLNSWIACL